MGSFLTKTIDFARHNAEAGKVWAAFRAGRPSRVPVAVSGSIRNFLQNPALNSQGWTFRDFFEKPAVQIQAQVEYQKWRRFNILSDNEMGWPEEGWALQVDFQNSYDAAWAGCPLVYPADAVPDTLPILAQNKQLLYDLPAELDDTAELFRRGLEYYDLMLELAGQKEYHGLPLLAPAAAPGEGTDGPLDLAYKMRGADNLLIDMLTDEKYYHDLMGYLTENLISRMKRMRRLRWQKQPGSADAGQYRKDNFWFADDAIALLSPDQYKEYVYPYHKRFFAEFSTGSPASMHLCGAATQHFAFLKDAFNVKAFDTGFPVDHGALREELGEDVLIYGGPTVMELKDGSPASIRQEVARICQSGVMRGGRFVLIAANNLAPRTPVENIQAMYEAAKEFGSY